MANQKHIKPSALCTGGRYLNFKHVFVLYRWKTTFKCSWKTRRKNLLNSFLCVYTYSFDVFILSNCKNNIKIS